MPPNTAKNTTAAPQEEVVQRPQVQAAWGMAHSGLKVETERQEEAPDSDSSDSGTGTDSDECAKSFEMVDKPEMFEQAVLKWERNDTLEDGDDFTVVNCSSPGLSSSFSAMKTGEDRSDLSSPKQRSAIRKKPYDHVKEDVNEKAAAAILASQGQPLQASAKLQLGAASSPSSAGGVELGKTSLQEAAACVKQEDSKSSTPVDFQDVHKKLCDFVNSVLSVDNLRETFQCCEDAIKLRRVAMIMTESNQLHKFLMVFSHSVSCINDSCSNTCRMFRRTRGHVGSARHACALMHVYSQLLRMHIDTCVDDNCGLVTCKSMLAMRQLDNLSVLPRHFRQLEQLIAQKTGKVLVNMPVPAASKADDSENKENIALDTAHRQASSVMGCAGVIKPTKRTVTTPEDANDKALDLSKTGRPFVAHNPTMTTSG